MMPTRPQPEDGPLQYTVGQPCAECQYPLSRYNPYVVCGPCRMRLAEAMAGMPEDDYNTHSVTFVFPWERFAKRKPVRQGSLLEQVA